MPNFIRPIQTALLAIALLGISASAAPFHKKTYVFMVTNSGAMPISPGVLYSIPSQKSLTEAGSEPSPGLIQLCQTGDASTFISELKSNRNVKAIAQFPGLIFPGQSASVEIQFENYGYEALHFVAMYGKSKELCSNIDLQSQTLNLLRKGYAEILGNDKVISAGAFTEPIVQQNAEEICADAADGVSCLRRLAIERTDKKQIHAFAGYLPSVLNFLENKYGADDVLSLVVPPSGAVNYSLRYK